MAALWGGLASIACRAAPPPEPRVPVALSKPPVALSIPGVAQGPPETASGPPRWVLLPKPSHWVPAFQRSTDVGTLYAGAGNERWLLEGEAARGAGPDPVALVGALPNAAGFTFITAEGEVYEASSALGDLSLAGSVSKPYVDAAAGRDHFVAIDEARTLQRSSDRGRTWQPVSVPRHQGELVDVVMLETGAGLLLANRADTSELFSTKDDGATWHKVHSQGQPFIGLVSAGEELRPVIRVNRQHEFYLYATLDTGLSRVMGQRRRYSRYTPFPEGAAIPPDLAMFVSGQPAAPGVAAAPLRWAALREASWEPSVWELSVVPFGEPPSYRVVEWLAGCAVAATATTTGFAIACRRSSPRKGSLFLSQDGGESFRKLPLPPSSAALSALEDVLVVQTPCDEPVETRGPFLLAPPDWRARRVSDTVCRTHLAFTPAGEPGMFFSAAWANQKLTLHRWAAGNLEPELVSVIGTVPRVPIERVSLSRQGATVMVGVPTPYSVIEGSDPWDPNGVATAPRPLLFRSNDGGRHFGEVALPSAFRALALAGRRGLGIDHDAVAFETDDFGTNWSRVPAPVGAGHGAIECNDSGCITRRGLRVGWER